MMKTCVICGAAFDARATHMVACSQFCRDARHNIIQAAWNRANRDKRRAYRQRNREKINARSCAIYKEHKDDPVWRARQKAIQRTYYQRHRDKVCAKSRARNLVVTDMARAMRNILNGAQP